MKTGIIVTIVVILSILGLGFFQYKQLEGGSATKESLSALSTAFSTSVSSADADISQVNQLLSVLDQVSVLSQLDLGLFKTPKYAGLKDFSVTLFPAQSIGRNNPFLGIDEGGGAVPVTTTTTTVNRSSNSTGSSTPGVSSGSSSASSTQSGVNNSANSAGSGQIPNSSGSSNQSSGGGAIPPVVNTGGDTSNQQQSVSNSSTTTSSAIPVSSTAGCDPFTDPSCLDDDDAINAFIQAFSTDQSSATVDITDPQVN